MFFRIDKFPAKVICLILLLFPLLGNASLKKAAEAEKIWSVIDQPKVGVNYSGDFVFFYMVVDVRDKDKRAGQAEVIKELGGLVKSEAYKLADFSLSLVEKEFLNYAPVPVDLTGHIVLNTVKDGALQYVLAVEREGFVAQTKQISLDEELHSTAKMLETYPLNNMDFFKHAGLMEIPFLKAIQMMPDYMYSFEQQPISFRRAAVSISDRQVIRKELVGLVLPEQILGDSLRYIPECVEEGAGLTLALNDLEIKVIDVSFKDPFLIRLLHCNGFAKLPVSMPSDRPVQMDYIEGLFSRGEGLPMAIYLLEKAVTESPRNKEVWEFLTAAYLAAGKVNKARISARMWVRATQLSDGEAWQALNSMLKIETKSGLGQLYLKLLAK